MIARCEQCGAGFVRADGERWKTLCLPCWRRSKADDTAPARAAGAALDAGRIRQLLQLVHPDKHAGSELATELTQWLLQQRAQLRGAAR